MRRTIKFLEPEASFSDYDLALSEQMPMGTTTNFGFRYSDLTEGQSVDSEVQLKLFAAN